MVDVDGHQGGVIMAALRMPFKVRGAESPLVLDRLRLRALQERGEGEGVTLCK